VKQAVCEVCGASHPMGETLLVYKKRLCQTCAEQFVKSQPEGVPEDAVQRQADPTVCVECKKDHGEVELERVAGLPVCPPCAARLRNRPFPAWVKISFVALLLVTVVSFVVNLRFMRGYLEVKRANVAFRSGRIEAAARLSAAAAKHVPESKDLAAVADFYQALHFCEQDQPAQALPLLQKTKQRMPNLAMIDQLIVQQEMGLAFDTKDYDKFLDKARAMLKLRKEDSVGLGSMASALACKYATTGDEAFKKQSLEYLDRARKAPGLKPAEFADLEERILYRLESREIIDRKEFKKRFPNGWKKP
jgi:hypothetical protein